MPGRADDLTLARSSSRDLATFNRWLCLTRLRATAAVTAFVLLVAYFHLGHIAVLPALGVCGGLALVSIPGLTGWVKPDAERTFFILQTFADLAAITAGIGFATEGLVALLVRPLYALVIVPPSLISVPIGLTVATAAMFGHGLLLGIEHGFAGATFGSFEFFAPAFFFYLVAQQCFFYGAHLDRKNRALEALAVRLQESKQRLAAEGQLSAELAEAARVLSATLDTPEPLANVSLTLRNCLSAEWGAVFVVDGAGTFRLRGVTDEEIPIGELGRFDFPLTTWPAVERLREERVLVLSEAEIRRVPALFTGGRMLSTVLAAALYRDGEMAGFLAVGYGTRLVSAREWASHLLAGIAEHASIVLQNARLLEEVRAASALKSEFVGAVSHELRSPLNVILGYLEMVLDRGLGPLTLEQVDALGRTHRQSIALLEMITALLDLNRFEAGRLPLQRARVDLGALLTELCEHLPDAWRRAGVKIQLELAPDLPVVETDGGKLKTVVRNLLHNALKFTEHGEVTLGATVTSTGELAIVVRDTGCGIPPEALAYVFDMFRQVPGSGGGGVGLGLHIVRRFVEALGGTVNVESAPGRGSCFTVTLPRAAPATEPAARPRAA
jgi:signal transduction histidine kinase